MGERTGMQEALFFPAPEFFNRIHSITAIDSRLGLCTLQT